MALDLPDLIYHKTLHSHIFYQINQFQSVLFPHMSIIFPKINSQLEKFVHADDDKIMVPDCLLSFSLLTFFSVL